MKLGIEKATYSLKGKIWLADSPTNGFRIATDEFENYLKAEDTVNNKTFKCRPQINNYFPY